MALRPAKQGGYLKAGLYGGPGAGKTHTALVLAVTAREHFGLDGPIAAFDTEGWTQDVAARIKKGTGSDLLIETSRSIATLESFVHECLSAKVSVAVVDSLTHVWQALCDNYLAQCNERARRNNKREYEKLSFHHWNFIKPRWQRWVDLYQSSPLHIIVCGRRSYNYEYSPGSGDEVKASGDKMKAEHFGHECRALFRMALREEYDKKRDRGRLVHECMVMKDRFDQMTGAVCTDPGPDFFRPYLAQLAPATHTVVDTTPDQFEMTEDGTATWQAERRRREALCEELRGVLSVVAPSQTADDKEKRGNLLFQCFRTRSWGVLEAMSADELARGIRVICQETEQPIPFTAADDGSQPAPNAQERAPIDDGDTVQF